MDFSRDLIEFIFIYSIWQGIATIIPIKYPSWWGGYGGKKSDGLKAIEYLKL